jgi:hypothetical protein
MIPQLPIRNPFFDDRGNITVPWLRLLESLTRQNVLMTPAAPLAVAGELLLQDAESYGIQTTITQPDPLGDVVQYEVQAQFWDAAVGGTAQSEWITLGLIATDAAVDDVVLTSGYWPLPTYTSYCLLRARSLNYQEESSDWVEATTRFSVLSGNAPDVRFFRAGTSNGDSTFDLVTRVDTLGERVLVDWAAMRPQQLENWSHFRIFALTADGDYVDTTGPRDELSFQEIDGEYVVYDTIALEGSYLPTVAEDWDFIAVSANRAGELNVDGSGNPTGPFVTLSIQRPTGVLTPPTQPGGSDWALNALTYSSDDSGAQYVFISATILNPVPDADYYKMYWQQTSTPVDGEWIEIAADAVAGTWRDRPSAGASWVVAIVATKYSYQVEQPAAGAPYKALNIAAWGDAPQVTGFAVTVETQNRAGVPSGRFVFAFTKPASPDYYYTQISRIACDASYNPLGGASYEIVAGEVNPTKQMEWWPLPGTAEYWKFKAESVNHRKVVNATSAPTSNVSVSTSSGITQVAPSTLTTAAFASTIRPVELVAALPVSFTNYPQGAVVFLTSNNKLYRSTGSAWTVATDGADLVANSVTTGKIAAGAISTTELVAAEILVGGAGGKPTRFTVKDASNNTIGFIGDNGAGFIGAYLINLRVGTDINNPVITASSSGVSINGAPLTLNLNGVTTAIDNSFAAIAAGNAGFRTYNTSGSTDAVVIAPGVISLSETLTSTTKFYLNAAAGGDTLMSLYKNGGGERIRLTANSSGGIINLYGSGGALASQLSASGITGPEIDVTTAVKVGGSTAIDASRNWQGVEIPTTKGGTGATSVSGARTNLQLIKYHGYVTSDPKSAMDSDAMAYWWDGTTMWLVYKQGSNAFRVDMASY